jgi:hypothetical protein
MVMVLMVPSNFSKPIFSAGSKNVNPKMISTKLHCVSIFNGSSPTGKYRANNANKYVTISNGWNTKDMTFAIKFTLMKQCYG